MSYTPPQNHQGPALIIHETYQGQEQTYEIALAGVTRTIGRKKENDIQLSARFVSGFHARVEPAAGGGYQVVDVGSTNGTVLNGKKIPPNHPHMLNDGDVLRVSDTTTGDAVTMTYRASSYAPSPAPAPPPAHAPSPAPAPPPAYAPAPAAQTVVAAPERAPKTQALPVNAFDPNAQRTTIGRQGCDIELLHPTVSHFHAQIDRLPDGGHILRDAGSTNGTFVNGQRVRNTLLQAGDIIKIGPFKLTYTPAGIDQYDQRGAMRIDVRNMHFVVKVKGKPRTILNDISLSIAPREFVALVGGSGAGKSTLMKAISGFTRVKGASVLVNGDDYYQNFDSYRMMLGYVPQDDILHSTLPVDQALNYAAQLRLPSDTRPDEMNQRIESAVEAVEMTDHRAKYIKDLSGGQRKRVSIAAELLAEPSLFFLDEPTSGLDPGLEKKMMETLRAQADSGRTVVLVTHATENITQCHKVLFMSRGHMIYYGPPEEAPEFFGVKGGSFSEIYTRIDGPVNPTESFVQEVFQSPEYQQWRQANPRSKDPTTLAELWAAKYKGSAQYRRYVVERLNQTPPEPIIKGKEDDANQSPSISPLRQFFILTQRYLDLTVRDRTNLLILFLQSPIIALLLWFLADRNALAGVEAVEMIQRVEAQSFLFVLAAVGVWFGIINSAREITKEQTIFARERMSKLSIGAYISSKISVLGLLVFVQNVVLLGLLMLQLGDKGIEIPANPGGMDSLLEPLPVWLEMFITMMLTSVAGLAMGLLVSTISRTSDQAISIVPLLLIPQILFAGLIFKIAPAEDGIIEAIIWLVSLLMISRWALDALGTSLNLPKLCQLPNVDYDGKTQTQCDAVQQMRDDSTTAPIFDSVPFLDRGREAPDAFPNAFTFEIGHLLTTWGVLLAFVVVCLGITYALLRQRGN